MMTERKKVGHSQHLKAVNNPVRKEILKIINSVEKISAEELMDALNKEDVLNDPNLFDYHSSFLIQALCMEKVDLNGKIYYKILPGGKVVENF